MRSCEPDPLRADIVHVREDRRNGAGLAGRLGPPDGRVKTFDENLVHAIIGGKDLDCGVAELSLNLGLTRGHGSLLLDLIILPGRRQHFRDLALSGLPIIGAEPSKVVSEFVAPRLLARIRATDAP